MLSPLGFCLIIFVCALALKSATLTFIPPWGGVLQEEIFLKVRFQKWEGNSPTKSDFDFGRRTCRLCAIEGSFIQKQFQHLSCVHTIDLPFVPVFSFWNLRVQDRTMLPNEFTLFLSDFLHDVPIAQILCVVQNIEVNRSTLPLRFSQNAVLPL